MSLQVASGNLDAGILPVSTWYCATGKVSGSQAFIRINGTTINTGSLTLPWSGGDNLWMLGTNPALSVFLNGSLAEVIAYNRALSSQETTAVEQYLSAKWGLGF